MTDPFHYGPCDPAPEEWPESPPTERTAPEPELRIRVTQQHRGAYDDRCGRWKAMAFRGDEYLQHEYGSTQLEALTLLVDVMAAVRR